MNNIQKNQNLERSKSMCSLQHDEVDQCEKSFGYRSNCRRVSDSSVEICIINDSDSELSVGASRPFEDSGIGDKPTPTEHDALLMLEQKIDRLSDLFMEQCRLLSTIKDEIRDSKDALEMSGRHHHQIIEDLISKVVAVFQGNEAQAANQANSNPDDDNPAQSLLNAIEFKHSGSLDRDIRDALTQFLQSDELKERMVAATVESVRDVIQGCISKDMSDLYLPTLERSHRKLNRQVTKVLEEAFVQYEKSAAFINQTQRTSRTLRRALCYHQDLLEDANSSVEAFAGIQDNIEEILKNELKEWRQKVIELLSSQTLDSISQKEMSPPPLECVPSSPPQPALPEVSIIDQLMKSAEINKLIQDGDVNGAFERALLAADLSLVMAACRAADPETVFAAPCKLDQSILMSLVQQLATDMVHDTQLKCRYLEDAIIHLNTSNPSTRSHLPLVVGEVRKHLMKFLQSYPSHVASRRITLIIMAADKLLK